jgi:hypothetical protein
LHPFLTQILGGSVVLKIDLSSFLLSNASHLEFSSPLIEIVCGLLGIAVVLLIGGAWRRRKLKRLAASEAERAVSTAE